MFFRGIATFFSILLVVMILVYVNQIPKPLNYVALVISIIIMIKAFAHMRR